MTKLPIRIQRELRKDLDNEYRHYISSKGEFKISRCKFCHSPNPSFMFKGEMYCNEYCVLKRLLHYFKWKNDNNIPMKPHESQIWKIVRGDNK